MTHVPHQINRESSKNSSSNLWVTESNEMTQALAAGAGTIIGLILIIGAYSIGVRSTENLAALVGGIGLFFGGVGLLFFRPRQRISVDRQTRQIIIEKRHRFGSSAKQVRLDDIVDIDIFEDGDKEGGCSSYHLRLKLKTGKTVSLFTGFFDGRCSKTITEARRQQLMQFVNRCE